MKYLYLVALATLSLLSCSTTETRKANPNLVTGESDLSGKTFKVSMEGEMDGKGDDLEILMIFQKDTNAAIRIKQGSLFKNKPFSWRFIGDSVSFQSPPESMIVKGKQISITPNPIRYVVLKEPDGYLLKGKKEQLLLSERK